jgi:hypothetical protein
MILYSTQLLFHTSTSALPTSDPHLLSHSIQSSDTCNISTMKFISVILAFFAVVVMVQAAPLAKRGGPVGPGLSELVAIAEGILRKYGITKRDVEVPATVDTIKNDVTNIVGLSKDNFVDAIIIAVQADVSLSVDVHVDIKGKVVSC